MLMILNGQNVNNNMENQFFQIECLNSNGLKIKATINLDIKQEKNPTIIDLKTREPYTFQGDYKVYYFIYNDEEGRTFKEKDIRTSDAFYKLYKDTDSYNIKMLIKGCSIDYYMVKFLKNTLYAMKLSLGERVDYKTTKVSIFSSEEDIEKVVTLEEQNAYYNQWLKSIEGLPY
ncbi:hypothetical protein [Gilliamella sp. ESL0443]|nr:hypothetical protein [Gilliamella sp. ESL0443]QYN42103.1 hypothetical protein GYM76_04780 [Gilliamella sp. ESL0443]